MIRMLGIACLLVLFSCSAKLRKAESAKLLYVDEDIATFTSVECENFENQFSSIGIAEELIKDSLFLQQAAKYIQTGKNISSPRPDVRTKFILNYSDGGRTIVCFDRFNQASIDGQAIALDSSFFKLIRSSKY